MQSVEAHLLAVGALTRTFAEKVGLAEQGELIGLLHDLGKYSSAFQAYLKSAVGVLNQDEDDDYVDAASLKGKIDHSTAGAQLAWRELSERGELGGIVGQLLALCIASHHSGLIDCLTSGPNSLGEDAFGTRMSKSEDRSHALEAREKADARILSRVTELLASPEVLESGKIAIGKIIRSTPEKRSDTPIAQLQLGLLVRILFSCLIDADRIDTADFEKPRAKLLRQNGRYVPWDILLARLERHLDSLETQLPIDQLRREISAHCRDRASERRGTYSLTVPTGGGKTLASLRFALHHARAHAMHRVIYFIPFTSIIDQNAADVRHILEPSDETQGTVVLEHHSNLTEERETWRSTMLAQDWDAPVVFTTNVQFLEAMFGEGTRSARRMHQLAHSVLIFDEAQTLPIECVHLFNCAVNFLVEQCGSTVAVCTATQPLLAQVNPTKGALRITSDGELMPDVKGLFDKLRRVEVLDRRQPSGWTNEEILRLAMDEIELTGSCLVVVNTKKAAQTIRQMCRESGELKVYHLSTNMCPTHRVDVLAELKSQLAPTNQGRVLCVSTQLIEAGVNLDFGSVIRFAAGLDSIAQAAGRCNRHGRRTTGRVHVVNPTDENLDKLMEIRVGRGFAERVMDDFRDDPQRFDRDLIGIEAMRWYYQNYFFARAADMDYPVSAQSMGHSDTILNLLSVNTIALAEHGRRSGRAPDCFFRQSFTAGARAFKAINAPTRGILVPYGERGREIISALSAAYMPEKEFDILRRAQHFSVNVFPHVLDRLGREGAVREIVEGTGILALLPQYYGDEFGLSVTPVARMELLNG